MTTPWLYLTWYRIYLCYQTHLIDDMTPYVRMKSHPLHAWHHRHYIWHHIHSCWQHTIVCMSWHTLCLWNHMHEKWCLTCCVYDYLSSIPGVKPVKTAISSTLYAITPSQSKTSHLLCKASQVAYVCHEMHSTGHHIHTLSQQRLVFMTLHALYSVHHMHYIWQRIYSVWCEIHYIWYITHWLYLWYQTLYIHDIYTLYGITHSFMTTHHCVPSQTLCLILYSKYFWHYTKCTIFMTRSQCKSSHLCNYDITASIYETTSNMLGHIYTIRVTSQTLIGVITLTLLTTSHTLCMASNSPYVSHFCTIQDITSLLYDI